MTTPTADAAGDAPIAPSRPSRRGTADLPFRFPDRGLAQALAAERSEPDWLRAERLAAFTAYDALPVEVNRLYTPYVDLRPADLMTVRPYVQTAASPAAPAPAPEGTSGLIELREDGVTALALSAEAAAAGVVLETFATALERDPDGLRADLEGGRTLPVDDKLAQLARGFWSHGVRLVVPAGVRLERPIPRPLGRREPRPRARVADARHARRGCRRVASSRSSSPPGRASTAPRASRSRSRSSAGRSR